MLENRPIVVITIGYIIGIIMGLYFKFSIALFYFIFYIIYLILKKTHKQKFKLISVRRYFRYVKIIFTKSVAIKIIIVSIISNSITLYQNQKYEKIYSNLDEEQINAEAIVVSNAKEKNNKKIYKIKIENMYVYLYVNDSLNVELNYGEKIVIEGIFEAPSTRKNYKGFDYSEYLKTLKICGILEASQISKIKDANKISLSYQANSIFLKIKNLIQSNFDEDTSSILLGILLGYTDEIDEDIKSNFQESNISYVLAVSGMHVGYIILFLKLFLEKIVGKKKRKIITIVVLIIYMFITGFSPSIVRAGIMGILSILASLLYRKSDKWQNISLALLILLIYNPFLIKSTSMWLTFIGTLGVMTISAPIAIAPIIAMYFNKVPITSLIISIVISVFIGPAVISILIFVIFYNVFNLLKIKNLFIKIISIIIKLIINLTEIGSNLPFNQIYVTTPNIIEIILYYFIIFSLYFFYLLYRKKEPTIFQKRIKNLVHLFKFRFNQTKRKIISIILCLCIICVFINIIPGNLEIYFIDVGQGDSTLIITPTDKKILIDGGGSEYSTYNIGENILLPYLLDRGVKSLDYVIISHFDSDHVGGILYVLEEISVKNVIIGKQYETSDNLEEFLEITSEKNINIYVAEAGDRINIENNLYFDILWPQSDEMISENAINNNSLVCKLNYKDFSMLFTGDIEEVAENAILEKYKNPDILKSTVLKVAHHGSKTSSSIDFLYAVSSKIALIGVGENNSYGHPASETLEKLEQIDTSIYRTDTMGEITIKTDGRKMYKLTKFVDNN